MSLVTDIEARHIVEYANYLKQQYELNEKLSFIHDELVNLSCCMCKEDIDEAHLLFERLMDGDELCGMKK